MSAQGPVERLGVIAHELRSPVAALTALAAAGRSVPPSDRPRLVSLAVAAARDIERILSDPELISLRLEAIDVGALADGLRTDAVTVAVTGRPRVVGDRTRLRQILANLAQNGLRHGSNVLVEVGSGTAWSSSTSSTTAREWRRASTSSPAARAAQGRRVSAFGSRARSPRHTAARSTSSPSPARGRDSGFPCRPLPPRAEPELRGERLGASRNRAAHRPGLEHHGLAAVGKHLGQQPLLGLERDV